MSSEFINPEMVNFFESVKDFFVENKTSLMVGGFALAAIGAIIADGIINAKHDKNTEITPNEKKRLTPRSHKLER